jgi:soluble lytic murein transglycosylase-like protein
VVEIPIGFRFYKDQIKKAAEVAGLEPAVVAAVCWQESSFCADGYRFEPDFWNRYLKQNPKYRHLNPRRVSASYGLMQVMYPLVHEDRLVENDAVEPEALFSPTLNLATGCGWLRKLVDWAAERTPDQELVLVAALASYNGGRGGNDPSKDSPLRNARYAREVLAKVKVLRVHYK